HMAPHRCLRRGAYLLHRSRPLLAFPWPLLSLSAVLFAAIGLARSFLSHPGFLMQQPQHALPAACGHHGQHRVHEEAAMAAIANGSQAPGGGAIAIIQLRIIMHDEQDTWLLLHLLTCLLDRKSTRLNSSHT